MIETCRFDKPRFPNRVEKIMLELVTFLALFTAVLLAFDGLVNLIWRG